MVDKILQVNIKRLIIALLIGLSLLIGGVVLLLSNSQLFGISLALITASMLPLAVAFYSSKNIAIQIKYFH